MCRGAEGARRSFSATSDAAGEDRAPFFSLTPLQGSGRAAATSAPGFCDTSEGQRQQEGCGGRPGVTPTPPVASAPRYRGHRGAAGAGRLGGSPQRSPGGRSAPGRWLWGAPGPQAGAVGAANPPAGSEPSCAPRFAKGPQLRPGGSAGSVCAVLHAPCRAPPAPHGSGPSAEPPPPLSAMRVGALAGRERGARRRRSAGRGGDAAALGVRRDEVCAPRAGARRAFARIDSSCQECRLEGNSGGGK